MFRTDGRLDHCDKTEIPTYANRPDASIERLQYTLGSWWALLILQ